MTCKSDTGGLTLTILRSGTTARSTTPQHTIMMDLALVKGQSVWVKGHTSTRRALGGVKLWLRKPRHPLETIQSSLCCVW